MKARFRVAGVATLVAVVLLLLGMIIPVGFGGRTLQTGLFYAGLYFAVIRPAEITAGLFSEERRNQTLELLYLTGMSSMELFSGKVLGGALVASFELLALFPFLALPFLSGGVSLELFLGTATCLTVLFLFTLAVCLLASVVCSDDGTAMIVAGGVAAVIALATPLPYFLGLELTKRPPFSSSWLCGSPAYAGYLVGMGLPRGQSAQFWWSALATLLWAVLLLVLAAVALSRNWRNDPDAGAFVRLRRRWREGVRGSAAWRGALRVQLLDHNPFQWLAERDRQPVLIAAAMIIVGAVFWMAGWWAWPKYWPCTANFFLTAFLLIVAVEWLALHSAARLIGSARRDGSIELLLTTPLTPIEIVEGQLRAVHEQFKKVRWAVLALCALMMLGGFTSRSWSTLAIVSYSAIWLVFCLWSVRSLRHSTAMAMWVALNSARPVFAVFRSQGARGWWWVWALFNARNMFRAIAGGIGGFPKGSPGETAIVLTAVTFILILAFTLHHDQSSMPAKIMNDMRSIAQEPVPDPHDPRFKKWNVNERLPNREQLLRVYL